MIALAMGLACIASSANPLFFYALQGEGKCEWRAYDPRNKSDRLVAALPAYCPEQVLVDTSEAKEPALYYVNRDERKLHVLSVNHGNTIRTIALPAESKPPESEGMGAMHLWKRKEDGKIHFAFFDSNPTRVARKPTKEDAYQVLISYRGQPVGSTGSLGIVGAAVEFELNDNKWKFIRALATNSEACDTVGLGVLSYQSHPKSFSAAETTRGEFTCVSDSECLNKNATVAARKALAQKFPSGRVYYAKTQGGWALASGEDASGSEYSFPGLPALLVSPDGKLLPVDGLAKDGVFRFYPSSDREWFSLSNSAKVSVFHFDSPAPAKGFIGEFQSGFWAEL